MIVCICHDIRDKEFENISSEQLEKNGVRVGELVLFSAGSKGHRCGRCRQAVLERIEQIKQRNEETNGE